MHDNSSALMRSLKGFRRSTPFPLWAIANDVVFDVLMYWPFCVLETVTDQINEVPDLSNGARALAAGGKCSWPLAGFGHLLGSLAVLKQSAIANAKCNRIILETATSHLWRYRVMAHRLLMVRTAARQDGNDATSAPAVAASTSGLPGGCTGRKMPTKQNGTYGHPW
jgi:hypothetical protein